MDDQLTTIADLPTGGGQASRPRPECVRPKREPDDLLSPMWREAFRQQQRDNQAHEKAA